MEQYLTNLYAGVFPGEIIQFSYPAKGRGCASPLPDAKFLYDEHLEQSFPDVSVAPYLPFGDGLKMN